MAGVVIEHVPASLAEQQKHLFRGAIASNSRIDCAAMRAREMECLIAADGHSNPLPDMMLSPRAMPVKAVSS